MTSQLLDAHRHPLAISHGIMWLSAVANIHLPTGWPDSVRSVVENQPAGDAGMFGFHDHAGR